MLNKFLLLTILTFFTVSVQADQCLESDSEANPYLLNYNCSFLTSSSFRTLVGFGGKWQKHLSVIKSFIKQDCLGIDKLVNHRIQKELNDRANRHSNENIRSNVTIRNSGSAPATKKAIEAIYGR